MPKNLPPENSNLKFEDALAKIFKQIKPKHSTEFISTQDCLGRIVAKDIISNINVPNHTNSAMDGYAITSADLNSKQKLEIIYTCFAGDNKSVPKLSAGKCMKIFTGAVVDDSVDMIIPQEFCKQLDENFMHFEREYTSGANIRYAGEDIKKGQVIFSVGRKISSADIGLLASMGIAKIAVVKKLKVAIFSTGDELIDLDKKISTGQVYDSNRYMLNALLKKEYIEVIDFGIVSDNLAKLKDLLKKASKVADVILTSGGVSVGEADLVKTALDEVGQIDFWKLNIKPGKPLAFGKINSSYFFGLPGNPVAVFVCFHQIALPSIKYLSGIINPHPQVFKAKCNDKINNKKIGRREFIRANLIIKDNNLWVSIIKKQGSGVLSSVCLADCLVILPEDLDVVNVGDYVAVYNLADG